MQTETIPDEYSTCRSEQERRNKSTAGDRLHGVVRKEKRSSNTENFIECLTSSAMATGVRNGGAILKSEV